MKMLRYYFLSILTILLYLYGFFPIPTKISKSVEPPLMINNVALNPNQNYIPRYNHTVLMIIDALRLDFFTPTLMPFTYEKSQTNGCFMKLKVETPTVTMPRIKALMTGAVPQYVDVVLNLADTSALDDSLLHSAKKKAWKLVFYGDNTWLKLFPKTFDRKEGTSSFYVHDFYEVDDNVTRNVNFELTKTDWNLVILHYLGLDHIGHVEGPKSKLVPPKLKEMDEVIKKIYTERPESIIIVTADHGMRDGGSHGGPTYPETNVPLVVLGHNCRNSAFVQTDFAVNLALVLGLEIPSTNTGKIDRNFYGNLSFLQYLYGLRYNTLFLNRKLGLCNGLEKATDLHYQFLTGNVNLSYQVQDIYENCSKIISENLMKATKQHLHSLILAILIIFNLLLKLVQNLNNLKIKYESVELLLILLTITLNLLELIFMTYIIILLLIIKDILSILMKFNITKFKQTNISPFLLTMTILFPFSLISSSFIEEEHCFWYFTCTTFLLLTLLKKHKCLLIFLLIGCRFLQTINQTGDKWAHLPDFSDFLVKSENVYYLLAFFVLGLTSVLYCCVILEKNKTKCCLILLILVLIFFFKIFAKNSVLLGKLIWFLIIISGFFTNFQTSWLLICSLLLKPYNTILVSLCFLTAEFMRKVCNKTDFTLISFWLGNFFFFAQGHSNSVASVDISTGYIGLSSYNAILVITQVLCHTYAMPVLCFLSIIKEYTNIRQLFQILLLIRLFVIMIVFIVVFLHRYHLFIWSVFAPKLFVEASHCGFLFIQVCCYYSVCFLGKLFGVFDSKKQYFL